MSNLKVLLLEDDPNLGIILQEHLELNGFNVKLCVNGVEGSRAYENERYNLCLVDVMMPKKDGFTFAREIRAKDQMIPIIFLTAKSLKEDKIEGFKIGCDDYLTKPFSMEELLLRIQAVLKRSTAPSLDSQETDFNIGNYHFDSLRQILTCGKKEFKLTPKESGLLQLLCLHKNRVLERSTALTEIWGDESYFAGRSMDVYISKLRKYLKHDKRVEIMGVHGKGYRLMIN